MREHLLTEDEEDNVDPYYSEDAILDEVEDPEEEEGDESPDDYDPEEVEEFDEVTASEDPDEVEYQNDDPEDHSEDPDGYSEDSLGNPSEEDSNSEDSYEDKPQTFKVLNFEDFISKNKV